MCLVVMGERKTCLSNSLAWPAPTRKEGSGSMPNMQHPTDNWGCDNNNNNKFYFSDMSVQLPADTTAYKSLILF